MTEQGADLGPFCVVGVRPPVEVRGGVSCNKLNSGGWRQGGRQEEVRSGIFMRSVIKRPSPCWGLLGIVYINRVLAGILVILGHGGNATVSSAANPVSQMVP